MKKIRTLGPRKGRCNICGDFDTLTEDHVPPKGTVGISNRELIRLAKHLHVKEEKPRQMQDGVKFRTICPRCNNELLGLQFDPAIKQLCEEIALPLRVKKNHSLSIPSPYRVVTKPQLVARSVIGHLLAAHLRDDMGSPLLSAPFPDAMRAYFLETSSPLPEELQIFYWLYPSEVQVIIQNRGISWSTGNSATLCCSVLKFFPLSFFVVYQIPEEVDVHVPQLLQNRSLPADAEACLEIDISNIPRSDWPENPADNEIHLGDSETDIISIPPRTIRRRQRKK
jgi:hypothetical protein